MNRRAYLAGLVAGIGGFAGCLRAATETRSETTTDAATETATSTPESAQSGEEELPIPESELVRGAGKDAIPAITDPVFAPDWSGLTIESTDLSGETVTTRPRLNDEDRVIGVERGGEARAYPIKVLDWHEIVNDTFDGPLLVTFCPLCGSAVTAVRTVDGEETTFGVSGYLYKSDLVMYDQLTDSLWSQIMATAINGPKTGTTLELIPSTITTWGAWTDSHPETEVLLPPPESNTVRGRDATRDYSSEAYAGYEDSDRIGIGNNDFEDDRLHPKTQVIGVTSGDTAKAYPLQAVADAGVVNDTVGDRPVVVTTGPEDTLVAYERTVDGSTLTFEADGPAHLAAGGSRWERTTGRAVSGSHEGTTLSRANDRSQMFWFAWVDFHPDTALYGE